jgi:exonuclease SbcC
MILKWIRIENIRSYSSEKIEFPKGSVLLAGDIGSGKSTILLSIEFALFGLKQGELAGEALLSHSAKEGTVELCFEVDSKEIIIKRVIKRVKDKIGQAAGYIIVNGIKQELMPKELRAKIFEILNYPESLVSKEMI